MITTITELSPDKVLLAVEGELDAVTSEQLKKVVAPLMERKGLSLDVDLSRLDYISSRGLRVFLSLAQTLLASGGSVQVTAITDSVKEVFDLTGFSKFFLKK